MDSRADNSVTYEVFEEETPSYMPSYIMSTFVLLAIVALAESDLPLWPLSTAHVFLGVWFGTLFVWILRNASQSKLYMSDRLTVTQATYKHSFRYAVAEATHVEIPLSEIREVRISAGTPRFVEVVGMSDDDIYFLPSTADVEELIAALKVGNPAIQIDA